MRAEKTPPDPVAQALLKGLQSTDRRIDPQSPTTVVDALEQVARALQRLGNGNASTDFGAIEALGMQIEKSSNRIADSLDGIAAAIDRYTDAVRGG